MQFSLLDRSPLLCAPTGQGIMRQASACHRSVLQLSTQRRQRQGNRIHGL